MPDDCDPVGAIELQDPEDPEIFDRITISRRAIEVGLWELEGCDGPPEELVSRIFRSMYLANGGALPITSDEF